MSFRNYISQSNIKDVTYFDNVVACFVPNSFVTKSHEKMIDELHILSEKHNSKPVLFLVGNMHETEAPMFNNTNIILESFLEKSPKSTIFKIKNILEAFSILDDYQLYATSLLTTPSNGEALKHIIQTSKQVNYFNTEINLVPLIAFNMYRESMTEGLMNGLLPDVVATTNHSYDFICKTLHTINKGLNNV